jgi:hypothetical protein
MWVKEVCLAIRIQRRKCQAQDLLRVVEFRERCSSAGRVRDVVLSSLARTLFGFFIQPLAKGIKFSFSRIEIRHCNTLLSHLEMFIVILVVILRLFALLRTRQRRRREKVVARNVTGKSSGWNGGICRLCRIADIHRLGLM